MKRNFVIIICMFMIHILFAQNRSAPLKLGLALSGGGAKGIAQIPVLEELEKRNIPVYCVTGTSIGSIVGGLYAMGYTPEQIKHLFFNQNWEKLLSDNINRTAWAMYMKPMKDRYSLSLNFDRKQIYLPSGLIDGHNIEKLLNRYTLPFGGHISFDSLLHPFACVATELTSGRKKVFHSGYLADAIRASMSIPSVFSPVQIEDSLYVDGGLVQNNPVQEAFELGADIVLAVNIGAPLKSKEELNNFIAIMDQSLSFAMDKASHEALQQADFIIAPNIKRFGVLDFSLASVIYDSGFKAVQQSSALFDTLQNLTDTTLFQPNPGVHLPERFHINAYEIKGGELPEKELFYHLHMNDGLPITWKQLERIFDLIYGRGLFKNVHFKLDPNGENSYLLHVILSGSNPNMLAISHHFDTYNEMEWLLTIFLAPWKNKNTRLLLDSRLGNSPEIRAGIMYFLPRVNALAFILDGSYKKRNLTLYERKISIARYKDERLKIKGSLVQFIRNTALLSVSAGFERSIGIPVIGLQNYPRFTENHYFTSTCLRIDQLNHRYFPTVGYFLEASFRYNWHGWNDGYWEYGRFKWNLVWNIHKKHVFYHNVDVGTTFNSSLQKPVYFFVGGYHSFYGYQTSEFLLRHFAMEELGYRIRFNPFLYFQFSLQGIYPMKSKWTWKRELKHADFAINWSTRIKLPITQVSLTFTHSDYRKFLVWFEFGFALDFPF